MITLKFGGTSVGNATNMRLVSDIIAHSSGRRIVVLSAMSKVTDKLNTAAQRAENGDSTYTDVLEDIKQQHIAACGELLTQSHQSGPLSQIIQHIHQLEELLSSVFLLRELTPRVKDLVASYGELLSSLLVSAHLKDRGIAHRWIDSREIIVSDDQYGNAKADLIATQANFSSKLDWNDLDILIAPGFIAANKTKHTTTLGRGGSDYSAAIYAYVSKSTELQIWTDVSGMMTADPRICAKASTIATASYDEAMELSHFGAKVIYPPTLLPVMHENIPVRIKNTFEPSHPGTLITREVVKSDHLACGISSLSNIAMIQLEGSGMVGIPGFSARLFDTLARQSINIILITQGSSEHSICIAVNEDDSDRACAAINQQFALEIHQQAVQPATPQKKLSIIAIVGDQMKDHTGISGRFFSALGKNGISIRAIAQGSSERNISAVIQSEDANKAILVTHEAFFEAGRKEVHVVIAGLGNVGSKLVAQIEQQQNYLLEKLRIDLRIVGLVNSRHALLDSNGINLSTHAQVLDACPSQTIQQVTDWLIERNLRNSIFVDVTAQGDFINHYTTLLKKSIRVVACNKSAASAPMNLYSELKSLASEFNTHFLFETNVGAGLPVITTINDLCHSGDQIHRIQAVLSGTLNYVFNHYDGAKPFSDVVRDAQNEGYTEPDPRLDLSGADVMRKLLILAREAGYPIEMENIQCNSFLPESCMRGTVEDFYQEMHRQEKHFKQLLDDAKSNNCRLKFVATLQNNQFKVGLEQIPTDSDLYHLYGKDNIVIIHSSRYNQQPLVIKGAGAGAEVTAAGIFADIIKASYK
jgi:bifunctional aspartokinase / homoserine dehydrogenase 1